jgi:coenzyme PQQ biosynthesis protein B
MQVKILGTAAGGGFPQWNCACRNCRSLRSGTFPGRPRTQLQVAVTSDGISWFLLNASPDLRTQIEANPFLYPRGSARHSPISGVLLTSADLDQSLGLLLLRELQPLEIFATASIPRILREDNSMFSMLHRTADQARWNDIIPGTAFEFPFNQPRPGLFSIRARGCRAQPRRSQPRRAARRAVAVQNVLQRRSSVIFNVPKNGLLKAERAGGRCP